jgi:hypothetical protein
MEKGLPKLLKIDPTGIETLLAGVKPAVPAVAVVEPDAPAAEV